MLEKPLQSCGCGQSALKCAVPICRLSVVYVHGYYISCTHDIHHREIDSYGRKVSVSILVWNLAGVDLNRNWPHAWKLQVGRPLLSWHEH